MESCSFLCLQCLSVHFQKALVPLINLLDSGYISYFSIAVTNLIQLMVLEG